MRPAPRIAAHLAVSALLTTVLTGFAGPVTRAELNDEVEQVIRQHVEAMLPPDGIGGVALAARVNAQTRFFNYGSADVAKKSPVTTDSIFNLASVGKLFAATLLAQAVKQGELRLDEPVADYVTELAQGADIRRVTLAELASHTSGLPRGVQNYEPWHKGKYSLPDFIRFLQSWKADKDHQPGKQYLYSNAAFVLLRIALERRFNVPFATLMRQRLTQRLAMSSTALPLPAALLSRAVQGYGAKGRPVGAPGEEQGALSFPSAGQIHSSARDMAALLTASLGELGDHRALEDAMALAQRGVFTVSPQFTQALAWQVVKGDSITIVEKNGGLNNSSTYIGMVPQKKIGLLILSNRWRQPATRVGREILYELAQESPAGSRRRAGLNAP
jgi:beta-lactamase class C